MSYPFVFLFYQYSQQSKYDGKFVVVVVVGVPLRGTCVYKRLVNYDRSMIHKFMNCFERSNRARAALCALSPRQISGSMMANDELAILIAK